MNKTQKFIFSGLVIWTLLNIFAFVNSPEDSERHCVGIRTYSRNYVSPCEQWVGEDLVKKDKYVFINTIDLRYYDYTELILYVGFVWVIFFLYLFLIKK